MSWWEGIKDELGWSVEDAAQEEVDQGKRKGYSIERGPDGGVKRGFWENLRDEALGNNSEAINKRARELYIEKLQKNNPEYRRLNSQLEALNQDERVKITSTTNAEDLKEQILRLEQSVPILQGIKAKGGGTEGLTTRTDIGTLAGGLEDATTTKRNTDTTSSPEWIQQQQRYIDALDRGNKQFAASMALNTGQMALSNKRADNQMEIAQMQQQLQMRRQDSADRRADRRDRQAMIQQLMGGLSALGTSIAI